MSAADLKPLLAALAEKHGNAAVEQAMAEIIVPASAGQWKLSNEVRAHGDQLIVATTERPVRKAAAKSTERASARRK